MSEEESSSRPVTERDLANTAVWERLQRAIFFIKEARSQELGLSLTWCWEVAAESLWSAVEIFNKKVATSTEDRLGRSRAASQWFHESGRERSRELVDKLRNGAVHYDEPYGYGEQAGGGKPKESFLWLGLPCQDEQLAVEDVPDLLQEVADRVGLHVITVTGSGVISMTSESDSKWLGGLMQQIAKQKEEAS